MDSREKTLLQEAEGMDHIPYRKIKDSFYKETARNEDKCCPVLWNMNRRHSS